MPIMSCRNRLLSFLLLSFPAVLIVTPVSGEEAFSWIERAGDQVRLTSADGNRYLLSMASSVEGVLVDKRKHRIGHSFYLAVFQVHPSNPENPLGFCGAGNEVRLHVLEALGNELREKTSVLVSSCLHSISLRSQNTGNENQDMDFSSITWSDQGFSIDWFNNKDALGRSLQSTEYALRNGSFSAHDLFEQP